MRSARPRCPYIVKEMDPTDFFDFKSLADNVKNFDLDTDRSKIKWSKPRTIKLTSENPNVVHFQYDYEGDVFELDLLYRARWSQDLCSPSELHLQQLRDEPPKLSLQKFKDLVYLCNKNIIPRSHHCFYAI